MIVEAIRKLVAFQDLTMDEAESAMEEIMAGGATEAQTAAFLTALRMKGERPVEVASLARAMRKRCRRIKVDHAGRLLDTCGTGGDKIKTFNFSTLAAIVAAGAGIPVAKHGNRSVTGPCGSADLMEALGLNLESPPSMVEEALREEGLAFLYAPLFHPAMRYASKPRREIGFRTVFNLLGPLTNPAGAEAQLLGVYDECLTEFMAETLSRLGVVQAAVVHGLDGLDEFSPVGATKVTWLRDGSISTEILKPSSLGLQKAKVEELTSSTPLENALTTVRILTGNHTSKEKAKRDGVVVNAALAILLGGRVGDLREGVEEAERSLESGSAYKKLKALIGRLGDPGRLEELEERA
ncbi:MAG: anthranilate phosphoribosyltransferase [Candidatus Bathyarchaeia archaeon]